MASEITIVIERRESILEILLEILLEIVGMFMDSSCA